MKLEIKTKKENKLLDRTEIQATIAFKGATPSNKEIKSTLASQLKADEKCLVLKHIYTRFGTPQADLLAYLYSDQESLKRIEIIKKPKKPGAAPKGKEKKEEKQEEVKKEEPKKEEKPKKEAEKKSE